jgi:hypothetical protein
MWPSARCSSSSQPNSSRLSTPDHSHHRSRGYTPRAYKAAPPSSRFSLQRHDLHHRHRFYREGSRQETCQVPHGYAPSLVNNPAGVRSHTDASGYFAEVDESGKEKWPRGEEKVWKDGLREPDNGRHSSADSALRLKSCSMSPLLTQLRARRSLNHKVCRQPCSNNLVPSGLQPRRPRRVSSRRVGHQGHHAGTLSRFASR